MKTAFSILATLSVFICVYSLPFQEQRAACGYESCHPIDPDALNVHLVAHSHDDVGWLKTVSQYYYGSNSSIQQAGVQYIIGSVVQALQQNPDRKFIQVESYFFKKWWFLQDEDTRNAVRKLVDNGQLQMVGGAWSMNDEAAAHYQSIIDNFSIGLRLLNDTFGECGRPTIGWQIDPFGHSREQASIFAQMGFDGFFFGRLDWRDKNARFRSKTTEMIWEGSPNLGDSSDIFTSANYDGYYGPAGFCFDVMCKEDPIIDDPGNPDNNYAAKIQAYADYVRREAPNYNTNNIMITMGGDFHYQDALSYFLNLDKLVKGFQIYEQFYEGQRINLIYSTPGCYLKAINDVATRTNTAFAAKKDDFFPYASDPHAYWTGYFTSRPTSKRYERQSNNLLQVAKQLSVQGGFMSEQIESLKEIMGVMQHHDAITGTEKQHVTNDYHRLMHIANEESQQFSGIVLSNLLAQGGEEIHFESCHLTNISYCPQTSNPNFIVTAYNPLSRNVSQYIHLPVATTNFTITDSEGNEVPYDILKSPMDFSYTSYATKNFTLVFLADNLPPLGAKVYHFVNVDFGQTPEDIEPDTSDGQYVLGDSYMGVEIDSSTGKLKSITVSSKKLEVTQELMYYNGAKGNNTEFEFRASGAYIFRPSPDSPVALPFTEVVKTTTYKGYYVDEVHQQFGDCALQVIRVYKNEPYIEFDWIVGPIDSSDNVGKEIISRFTVNNFDSEDVFYTDSNGRDMLRRVRNHRNTWTWTDEEPVAGNYYPVTAKISIVDESTGLQFSVLNDRAQGGSSLNSGEVELMVHRNAMDDDAFGVGERLNETQFGKGLIARGQHHVSFGYADDNSYDRKQALRLLQAPWVFVAEAGPRANTNRYINYEYQGLTRSLDSWISLLTLEPLSTNTILLRLEYIFEIGDSPNQPESSTVDLQGLFTKFEVVSLRETTLGGNQWLDENVRLQWNKGEDMTNPDISKDKIEGIQLKNEKQVVAEKDLEITLTPMQIRTFIAQIEYL